MTKILLVDDSRAVLDIGKRQLSTAGYQVVLHAKGYGALPLILAETPDAVLLEANSAALQGPQLCKDLREHPETARVMILLHSSLDEAELQQRVLECGADGYLSKLWSWEDRLLALGAALSSRGGSSLNAAAC